MHTNTSNGETASRLESARKSKLRDGQSETQGVIKLQVLPQVYNYIWRLGAVILGTQDQRAPRTTRAQVEPRESALDAASPVTLPPSSSISGRCPHAHRNGTWSHLNDLWSLQNRPREYVSAKVPPFRSITVSGDLEWIPGGGHRGLAQKGGLPVVSLTEDSCLQHDNGHMFGKWLNTLLN